MKRYLRLASVLAVTAVMLTGCSNTGNGGTGGDSQSPVEGGEIRIAYNSQPASLDPIASSQYVTRDVAKLIYEQLVSFDESFTPQPVLAKSADASSDFKKFTFELRDDVKFHDGSPMTADDVVASIQRWTANTTIGRQYFGEAEVLKESDSTVSISVDTPVSIGLSLLADTSQMLVIMPKAIAEAAGKASASEYIGTGPYKFDSWEKDQYIKLVKNTDYQSPEGEASGLAGEKKAYPDSIEFDIVTDASSRLSGLQSGQYDFAQSLPADSLSTIEGNSQLTAIKAEGNLAGLIPNTSTGPMANVKMRQALQVGLDLEKIGTAAFSSSELFSLDPSLGAPNSISHTDAGSEGRYNVADKDKAKQLIAESGYSGQTLRILTTHDYEYMYSMAAEVQAQLKELGVNSDLVVSDWATLLANRHNADSVDLYTNSIALSPNPITYIILDETARGASGWLNDPAMLEAKRQVVAATDDESRKAAYEAYQTAYYEAGLTQKLFNMDELFASQSDIGGYRELPGVGPLYYSLYRTN